MSRWMRKRDVKCYDARAEFDNRTFSFFALFHRSLARSFHPSTIYRMPKRLIRTMKILFLSFLHNPHNPLSRFSHIFLPKVHHIMINNGTALCSWCVWGSEMCVLTFRRALSHFDGWWWWRRLRRINAFDISENERERISPEDSMLGVFFFGCVWNLFEQTVSRAQDRSRKKNPPTSPWSAFFSREGESFVFVLKRLVYASLIHSFTLYFQIIFLLLG